MNLAYRIACLIQALVIALMGYTHQRHLRDTQSLVRATGRMLAADAELRAADAELRARAERVMRLCQGGGI